MIYIESKEGCVYCDRAKRLLTTKGIAFEERKHYPPYDEVREQFPSMRTFPIISEDDRLIGGYDSLVKEISKNENFGKLLLNE